MEDVIADEDCKEFDMLLGEIPNATSGHPLTGQPCLIGPSPELDIKEPSPTNKATNLSSPRSKAAKLYKSPQFSTNMRSMPIYGSAVFLNNPDNQKLESKGNGGYEIPELIAWKENSDLPDEKSFALSFEEMCIKDNPAATASTTASIKNNHNSSSHCCLLNGQCTKHLNIPLFGYDSADMNFPPFRTLDQISLSSIELEAQAPVMRRNGLVDLRDRMNGQYNVKLFKPYAYEPNQVSENLLGNFSENQQLPLNAMDMPVNPGMDTHQLLRGVHGVQLPNSCEPYFYAGVDKHIAHPGMVRHSMEEERYSQFCELYAHRLQNNRLEVFQTQKSMHWGTGPLNGITVYPSFEFLAHHQLECCNQNLSLNANLLYDKPNQLHCQYQLGLSGRVEKYWPSDGHKLLSADGFCSAMDSHGHQGFDNVVDQCLPEKILTRSQRVNSVRIHRSNPLTTDQLLLYDEKNVRWSYGHAHQPRGLSNGSLELYNHRGTSPDNISCGHASKSIQIKYNSVDEVVGKIYLMAKDQHGCRVLQRKLSEGSQDDINRIFSEIICHIVELMFDPFGNYLVQKLLEVCNEVQMMLILKVITRNTGELVRISCDVHGTRAVQKVIESLRTPEQISMVLSSLEPDIVSLIKNINGNHVAQRCLQCLSTCSEFVINAAIAHCVELATDKQGCCVLQNCLKHSDAVQKQRLMTVISSYSLVLSLDPFGNYVVQFVLLQKVPWATAAVLNQLKGNYEHLSMQKYSSNVVEKCLKLAGGDNFVKIVEELMSSPRLHEILQDKFGNYVMQSALGESKARGVVHAALVEAIRPHIPALRSSPFGKNILSCVSLSSVKKRIIKKPKENHIYRDALGPRHANRNGLSI